MTGSADMRPSQSVAAAKTQRFFVLHQSEAKPFVREQLRLTGILGKQGSLNEWFKVEGYVSLKDEEPVQPVGCGLR